MNEKELIQNIAVCMFLASRDRQTDETWSSLADWEQNNFRNMAAEAVKYMKYQGLLR